MVKDDPVARATPPNAVLYQLNVPPVPVAVNVAVLPRDTVTLAGDTLGAAGDAFKVITCTLEKEVLFLIIVTTPEVPLPATASI